MAHTEDEHAEQLKLDRERVARMWVELVFQRVGKPHDVVAMDVILYYDDGNQLELKLSEPIEVPEGGSDAHRPN